MLRFRRRVMGLRARRWIYFLEIFQMFGFLPREGIPRAEDLVNIRYVQLIINGTYGDQSTGATVAEFAVL